MDDEIGGVKLLLGLTRQLLVYFYTLLSGAKTNLEHLEAEVSLLDAFLKDASNKDDNDKDERFRAWEREIVDVIHDAENVIAFCKLQAESDKHRNFLGRAFRCLSQKNVSLAEMVKSLREDKVRPLFHKSKDFVTVDFNPPPVVVDSTSARVKNPRQKNVIPLEKEMDDIIHGLTAASAENLEVLSIVGMPGLGKSTMAWRIYNDPRIRDTYPIVVWVKIS